MGKIFLTQEKFALVDSEDFEWLSQWKWQLHTNGYAKRNEKGFYMHREIMKAKKGQFIDHINGNKLDNRKENLRFCNRSQNAMNAKKHKDSSSPYKRVYWDKNRKKWVAYICINYKSINLGGFSTPEEAYRAYQNKARELFGGFANG